MKITWTKNQNFIFYYFSFLLFGYSFFNANVRGITCALLGVFVLLHRILFIRKTNKPNMLIILVRILWIGVIVISLINNYDIKQGLYGRAIYFIMPIIFMICMSADNKWIECIGRSWGKICVFFAITTVLVQFIPILYDKIIINFFPMVTEAVIELNNTEGRSYNCGFALTAGINSLYMAIGTGFFGICYLQNKKRKYLITFILMLLSLFFTNKRGPLLFGVLAMIVIVFVKMSRKKFKTILSFALIYVALIIAIIFYSFSSNNLNWFNDEITGGRATLYLRAFQLFNKNPIWGNGWLSYQYLSGIKSHGEIMMTHNVFLQLLCESGIVGVVLVTLTFVLTLKIGFNAVRQTVNTDYYATALFALYGQVFFVLSCFTTNCFYDNVFFYFYMISCAISLAICSQRNMKE